MKNFKNMFKELVKDESGQGAAEYILLIALVVAIVMMFGDKIKTVLTGKTDAIGGKIDGAFQ